MPIIPTWLHGAIDYGLAVLLMSSPYLLGYDDQGPATLSAIGIAVVIIAYSVCTRYELAMWRVIPLKAHLLLDAAAGVVLVAAPWVLGFVEVEWVVHVGAGVIWLLGAVMTQTVVLKPDSPPPQHG